MKLLFTLLLIAGLGFAQIFGPAGIPLTWDFGIITFTADSLIADSVVISPKFTTSGATSYISMAGDTLALISTNNDDVFIRFQNTLTSEYMSWEQGGGQFRFSDDAYFSGYVSVASSKGFTASGQYSWVADAATSGWVNFRVDGLGFNGMNIYAAANDTIRIGKAGVVNHFQSVCDSNTFTGNLQADTLQMDAVLPSVKEISSATYTALVSDHTVALLDTCDVTLPLLSLAYDSVSAVTGYGLVLFITPENIGDCTVDANGTEEINGSTTPITLSPWDCLMIQATNRGWRIL